ncbi:mechanosensitive ion channel family protein [Providencia stuartii]|uniref:mechanosensitive ion channel family protein n=1 Tax=Providencia stuartii TaxID=588 RepID=UPI003D7FF286
MLSLSSLSIIHDKLNDWQHSMLELLPNIVTVCVLLVLFYVFAKVVKWLANIALQKRQRPALVCVIGIFSTCRYAIDSRHWLGRVWLCIQRYLAKLALRHIGLTPSTL